MKTAVEELSPTRVRLSVEVSFEELKPSLDKAYREVAQQARIPGFRPGKVPPRVIDMRIGRGAVLTEAVNDALPEFYSKAVQEAEVFVLGQPDVEITQLEDGKELSFTAEVEVRPKFELPDFDTLTVTVDSAEVTDDDIDEYLTSLRERFASLKGVQRAAEDGDYVTMDLSASVDGELVEDAQATGLSYQVGSGEMLEGLDEALTGLSAGESATFSTELAGGAAAGQEADVTVTVQSVKIARAARARRRLRPARQRVRHPRRAPRGHPRAARAGQEAPAGHPGARQGGGRAHRQHRHPAAGEVRRARAHHARENVDNQLVQMRMSKEDYLKSLEKTEEEFDADLVQQSERSVRVGFVLDELARVENLSVNQAELSYFVADQAQRMGISPEFFARQLTESNQIGVAITEVLRGKAATLAAERVTVTDDKGETIDVKAQIEALNSDVDAMLAAQAAAEGATDIEVDDLAIDVAAALEAEDEAETEVVLEAVAEAEAEAEVVDEAEAIVEDAEDAEAADEATTDEDENSPDLL